MEESTQQSATVNILTREDFYDALNRNDLLIKLEEKEIDVTKVLRTIDYEEELVQLQIELVKLQQWLFKKKKRIAIIFEGRDAAGKGGTIRRFIEHLNPRSMRVVALDKPTSIEKGQWYFTRYIKELPNQGEIVLFDRSWYNRAVVEPVMGFCKHDQYEMFLRQVPEFEHMLYEDGLRIVKFWFSISKKEQWKRFLSRSENPLKQWKLSPVDGKSQLMWNRYTYYKEEMFSKTHNAFSPWIIIKANTKKIARLEAIRYVLSLYNYEGKEEANVSIHPDPNIVNRYHRSLIQIDK
jgi:polyphosphate kinase 2